MPIKFFLLILISISIMSQAPRKVDTKLYELRIYHTNTGKLDDLIARFQNHTTKLFEKHGMENIGYWLPTKEGNQDLYYILSFPDKAARDASWKSFINDDEWKKVQAASEVNGKIISGIESILLAHEPFSPKVKKSIKNPTRTFELRTYSCLPGKFPDIEKRFREHTIKLFKKHGMTNLPYFKTIESEGKQPKLVYLLAHDSEAAAKNSFDTFRVDPAWIKVRDDSEKNGKIVEKVESIMMKPLPFSKYQ